MEEHDSSTIIDSETRPTLESMPEPEPEPKPKKSFASRSVFKTFLLVIFIAVYVVVGAIIFTLLEAHTEQKLRERMQIIRAEFAQKASCVSDEELEAFVVEIVNANNRGVSATSNVSSEPSWSIGQSIFFAAAIITTVGYGHVTPLSEGGKVFCIIYAIIGIPLTLIMFTAIVERLLILTTSLLNWLDRNQGGRMKQFQVRLMHLCIVGAIIFIFCFIIPAVGFMAIEDEWNFLDAFYYCFMSMTTIGLGDYIPGDQGFQDHRAMYKILCALYLFYGLIGMMLVLANTYDIPELNIGFHFYMKSDEDEMERVFLRSGEGGLRKYSERSRSRK